MTRVEADQARHRAELWAAIGGRGPVPAPPFPDPLRPVAGALDQPPAVCPPCLTGYHGEECDAAGCRCRCRPMLGLDGPFEFGDPTATDLGSVGDPDEERVA